MAEYRFSERAVAFKSEDGQMVVVSDPLGIGIFHSPDGEHYFQCFSTGASCKSDLSEFEGGSVNATNPSFGPEFRCTDDHLTFDKVDYTKVTSPEVIEYEPLPTTHKPSVLFRLADGRFFYGSECVFANLWPMGGWRSYIGTGEAMELLKTTKVRRFERVGNLVATSAGTLNLGRTSQWEPAEGEPIAAEHLNYTDYDIVETDESVKITAKSAASV